MLGQLIWSEKPASLEIVEIEGLRLLRGGLPRGEGWRWRRKLKKLLRSFRRQGVCRLLVPADFNGWKMAREMGLQEVNPLPFLRSNAGLLLILAMKKENLMANRCKIALRATRVGQEMWAAAGYLVPRVEDMAISAEQGGERLQNFLRQQWGLGVVPDGDGVVAAIRFDGGGDEGGQVVLSLFGECPNLGGLAVNCGKFSEFPQTEPLKLLAVLWESGRIDEGKLEFYLT